MASFSNPVKRLGFGMVYHVATIDPELSDGAYRTLQAYIMHAQQKGTCFPGRDTVAALRHKDPATITRHNQELAELGYITRERRTGTSSETVIQDYEMSTRLISLAQEILDERDSAKMRRKLAHGCAVEEEQDEEEKGGTYVGTTNQANGGNGASAPQGIGANAPEDKRPGGESGASKHLPEDSVRDSGHRRSNPEGNGEELRASLEAELRGNRWWEEAGAEDNAPGAGLERPGKLDAASQQGCGETGTAPRFRTYNLDDEVEYLSGTGARRDEITVACQNCQATITQEMDRCPDCGAISIWYNSRVWKRLHGKPDAYERKLKYNLAPENLFEEAVVRRFGKQGEFSNITQKRTVQRLERQYEVGYLDELLIWAGRKRVPFAAWVSAVKNDANYKGWGMEEKPWWAELYEDFT